MIFDDLSEEWRAWIALTPMERFRESEKKLAAYLANGGSLDPDPDPQSPFYFPEDSQSGASQQKAVVQTPPAVENRASTSG